MALLSRFSNGLFHISNCKFSFIVLKHSNYYVSKCSNYLIPYVCKSTNQSKSSNLEQKRLDVSNKYMNGDFTTFLKMVENRREEAQRSILVQVHSEQSCHELYNYCTQFGDVNELRHYALPESLHFILVEFKNTEIIKNLLEASNHTNKTQIIPVRSPLLWFRAKDKTKIKTSSQELRGKTTLVEQYGNRALSQPELRDRLQGAESFSDQMLILHEATKLSELGIRLRFLTARQIELALSGLFPKCKALPFGSSVNGFGKVGCDLDLVLQLDEEVSKDAEDGRLVFHAKTALANGRTQVQRHMEAVGDICQLFLPGCSHIRRILQARVPIVKYKQELMDVECDLSMTNMCAIHMGELLYLLGGADRRVRPLVFAVRCWAKEAGLTNPTPGRWITNFSLSLMVLFFLQHEQMLPTLNTLIAQAGPEDQILTSEGINCTFLRDITKLKPANNKPNTDSLEMLLFHFFEFYAAFDFGSRGISLAEGVSVLKPEHCALYIANPLERGLNVSKNVSMEETERLKIELRNAAWNMESKMDGRTNGKEAWGLVALLETPGLAAQGRNVFFTSPKQATTNRMVNVKELFNDDELKSESENAPIVRQHSESELRNVGVWSRKRSVDNLVHLQNVLDHKGAAGKSKRKPIAGRRRR